MTTTSVDDIGTRVGHYLAQSLGDHKYQLWFSETRIEIDEQGVALNAPHRFAADSIARRFGEPLREAARQALGRDVAVRIQADPNAANASAAPDARPRPKAPAAPQNRPPHTGPDASPRRRQTQPAQPLRHRLDDFVVGPCNELAYDTGLRLVDHDAHEINPLFVHGACGVGKTHLLQGLTRRYAQRHPDRRWRYCTAEQFTNEYIEAVRGNQLPAFRARLRKLSLLVVDDVHFLADKRGTQSEFLHTFDSIDLHGAKLVLASDCHPKLIAKLNEALVSRCLRGMVVEMEQPDRQTRQRLVESLAAKRSLNLEPGVVPLLADQTAGSVRELEGTLTTLKAMSAVGRDPAAPEAPVGRTLIGRVLGQNAVRRPQPIHFETILDQVCDHLGLDRRTVLSASRRRQVVLARSLAVYLGRQMTSLSFPELATAIGRSNHSTVITAFNRIKQRVADREPITIDPQRGPTTIDQLAQTLRHRVETAPDR